MRQNVFGGTGTKSERIILSLFWFLSLVMFDQLTKYFAFNSIVITGNQNFIDLALYRNYFFAFSLNVPTVLMYTIYFIVIVFLLLYTYRAVVYSQPYVHYVWVLILAGAVSNVGERILFGYVKDFIKLGTGFFNLADVYIVLGVIIIFFSSLFAKGSVRYS